MGVARFFKWLSERYPRINQRLDQNVELLPIFDNMYLDANGIIHTCSHPHDETISNRLTMEEMALGMLAYINKMVHTIRPKKVVFIAIDGCAPRAKMNQQRSRRFAAARDAELQRLQAVAKGDITEKDSMELFDSNSITPGTKFMADLSEHFKFFLRKQVKEDPIWQNLTVIYSGHDVPGEGEHKIMEYIRLTRATPGYDPQTRHCLCGLDADLIMLSLASHEPHFALLREMVDFNSFQTKNNLNPTKKVKQQVEQDKWELLHISTLRQYLELEFSQAFDPMITQGHHAPSFPFDLESIIDDWVLMVTLVGNDFLPHLPTMDIFEGALDTLADLYKRLLPEMGGYMIENGQLQWQRIVVLLRELGELEDEIFTQREEAAAKLAEKEQRNNQKRGGGGGGNKSLNAFTMAKNPMDAESVSSEDELEEANAMWARLREVDSRISNTSRAFNVSIIKEKYYQSKFGVSPLQDHEMYHTVVSDVVQRYVEGLTWVYQYYYSGVPSWNWFYPFHYAPLASDIAQDLTSLMDNAITFQKGEPFAPFTQLLACLPAKSNQCLPPGRYRELMTSPDSVLKDFYPTEWEIDENGKRNPWEFVNLLPFIDEAKLRDAVKTYCPDDSLSTQDLVRNKFGVAYLIQRDLSVTSPLKSTLPRALPDLPQAQTKIVEFFYSNPNAKHIPRLLPGYHPAPGDAILNRHPLFQSCGLETIRINIFGTESRKETFCLRLSTPDYVMSAARFIVALGPRRTVWCNFPYLHECEVASVVDMDNEISFVPQQSYSTSTSANITSRLLTLPEKQRVREIVMAVKDVCKKGNGEVGTGGIYDNSMVVVSVRPLNGMIEDVSSGEVTKRFDRMLDPIWVPAGMVILDNPIPDPRFMIKPALDAAIRFPPDTSVICVASKGYGLLGRVVSAQDNKVKCEMPVTAIKRVEIGHVAVQGVRDEYHTLKAIAQLIDVSPMVVDKILSSILVATNEGGNHHHNRRHSHGSSNNNNRDDLFDLGLNLRVGRDQIIPHYCRSRVTETIPWTDSQTVVKIAGFSPSTSTTTSSSNSNITSYDGGDFFEYSNEAIDILVKYKEKFPQIFDALSKHPGEREYSKQVLFGHLQKSSSDEIDTLIERVIQWLHQIPTYKLPLAPVSSKFMSKGAIASTLAAALELKRLEEAKFASATTISGDVKKTVIVELPVDVLIKPSSVGATQWLALSPTAQSPPKLGDRVLNFGSALVPFGHVGTVVAIHPKTTMVNVMFDKPFVGGVSLWGIAPGHGAILKWNCLLSLSRPQPIESVIHQNTTHTMVASSSAIGVNSNNSNVDLSITPPVVSSNNNVTVTPKPVGGVIGSRLVGVEVVPPTNIGQQGTSSSMGGGKMNAITTPTTTTTTNPQQFIRGSSQTPVVVTPIATLDTGSNNKGNTTTVGSNNSVGNDDDLDDLAKYWQEQMMKTKKKTSMESTPKITTNVNSNTKVQQSGKQQQQSSQSKTTNNKPTTPHSSDNATTKVTKILQPTRTTTAATTTPNNNNNNNPTIPVITTPLLFTAPSTVSPVAAAVGLLPPQTIVQQQPLVTTPPPPPKSTTTTEPAVSNDTKTKLNRLNDIFSRAHKTENRNFEGI
jgi:5'-3' exoribonuclease 1